MAAAQRRARLADGGADDAVAPTFCYKIEAVLGMRCCDPEQLIAKKRRNKLAAADKTICYLTRGTFKEDQHRVSRTTAVLSCKGGPTGSTPAPRRRLPGAIGDHLWSLSGYDMAALHPPKPRERSEPKQILSCGLWAVCRSATGNWYSGWGGASVVRAP